MTDKKRTAASARTPAAAMGKETDISIAELGRNVNPEAEWREKEIRRRHEENLLMWSAIKATVLEGCQVEHRGTRYERAAAIIYRLKANHLVAQVELVDRCGFSVVIAEPRQITVLVPVSEETQAAPADEEFEEASSALKSALVYGLPVSYECQPFRRVTAVIYRRSESGGFRIQAELEGCGVCNAIKIVNVNTAEITDRGTSAVRCRINMEESE